MAATRALVRGASGSHKATPCGALRVARVEPRAPTGGRVRQAAGKQAPGREGRQCIRTAAKQCRGPRVRGAVAAACSRKAAPSGAVRVASANARCASVGALRAWNFRTRQRGPWVNASANTYLQSKGGARVCVGAGAPGSRKRGLHWGRKGRQQACGDAGSLATPRSMRSSAAAACGCRGLSR